MKPVHNVEIVRYKDGKNTKVTDNISVEEPLEIRLSYHTAHDVFRTVSIAVTMRTPGEDYSLAKGFLFTEGVIDDFDSIEQITYKENIIVVKLRPEVFFDKNLLQRNFYASSSCGLCGKASIESIHSDTNYLPWKSRLQFQNDTLLSLPELLRSSQGNFQKTGGIHACALIDIKGNLVDIKEDVGRHNAMDKLLGNTTSLPLDQYIVIVSGRASFELVQKASKVGLPVLASIGAPSTLAIQLAKEQGMTLIGFLKSNSFNIYSHHERIV